MVSRNYLLVSLIVLAVSWTARHAPSQSVNAPSKTLVKPASTRPPVSPEQKHRDELFRALIKSRRSSLASHIPTDNVSLLLAKVSAGRVRLDNRDLKSLTQSVLAALDVPISSQLLVFTGSASQGLKVNPKNPRAIYFNDEVYVGMVPGGLLEMIGVDPEIGGVLYSFHNVGTGRAPTTSGGAECVRCHSRWESGYAQGFFVRSIIPNIEGRMVDSEAVGFEGHERPLGRRFGGWFVTSSHPDIFGKAGLVAQTESETSREIIGYKTTRPGQLYDPKIHLAESSDILAHLLHEHQIGFHNRLARVLMSASDDGRQDGERVLQSHAHDIASLVSYMLFRSEAALPEGGVVGDPQFIKDFSRNRRATKSGVSLKDLDLTTRLLKHRCSYMIYTRPWLEMPPKVKTEIYAKLRSALFSDDKTADHLSLTEKREIIQILSETLSDLPSDWK